MAAFVKACVSRFITCRAQVTYLGVLRNVKSTQNVWLPRGVVSPRAYSSVTDYGNDQDQPYRMKVVTHEDSELQKRVASVFIGKGGSNIQKFTLDCDIDFIDGDIWVSGRDAEGVQKTVERVTTEVQRIKDIIILPIQEKVPTDENEDIHNKICGAIIGKGGRNIKRLVLETGNEFQLNTRDIGQVVVLGADKEVVRKAAETVQQEIQRIKNEVLVLISEKVFTDENKAIHRRICRMLVGKEGANIKGMKSETGLDFNLDAPFESNNDFVVVSGTDAEVVKRAAEKVQQEVQKIKNEINLLIQEKVFTDENEEIHNRICGMMIGRGGENLKRIRSETGLNFELDAHCVGHLVISGTDAEGVKIATEKIQQEIQKIKNENEQPFLEKVFTDEDEKVHHRICGKLIGKGGENLGRIRSEMGLNFDLVTRKGYIIISGTDAEEVKIVTEKIQQEVRRFQKDVTLPFSGKVFTDEDEVTHSRICGMIIGRGGENLKRIRSETGLNFELDAHCVGHIVISVTDAEEVKMITDKIQQEVQRIQNESTHHFN